MANEIMADVLSRNEHDESRQGEVYCSKKSLPQKNGKKFYIESYGCAMNFADSEVVASILQQEGFVATASADDAHLILLNTCSIREKAEQTVRNRLQSFRGLKKGRKKETMIGVLGCMAERLKEKFLVEEKLVDMVVGPDAYRTLPGLIADAESGQKGVNVLLSREETYADIAPVRLNSNRITAFVSIMRGCNNMCSFCVVPFTRGRERSRDAYSIVAECRDLVENGYREVTLLGQNVDSYNWAPPIGSGEAVTFAKLLEMVALISPALRVRFSTSHPKDITDEVLYTIARYNNICNYIHLPVQSGNTRLLQLMNRTYTREWYLHKVSRIREIIPDCGISTDLISGFCTETEEEHAETLSLMQSVRFDYAYMYAYSERPGTLAARRFTDDISDEVKQRRLQEIIAIQNESSKASYKADIGSISVVLIEQESKRSSEHWSGRNSQNKVVVFSKGDAGLKLGDYAHVRIVGATQATLLGEII